MKWDSAFLRYILQGIYTFVYLDGMVTSPLQTVGKRQITR
jgi:hypothetical protein